MTLERPRFGDDLRIHIREALAEQGISDAELADRLGVSPSRVCHLLATPSRGRLSLKMVDRIADVLGHRVIVRFQPHEHVPEGQPDVHLF